jgi:hypothetical protein
MYPGPYTAQDRQHGALDRGLPTAEGFWVGMGAREMSERVGGGLLCCERSRAGLDGARMNGVATGVRYMYVGHARLQVTGSSKSLCVCYWHLQKRPGHDGCRY